ncbi:MAG: HU family DNA-binding protein [bacterium]
MNKAQLIDAVAETTGLSKTDAKRAVESVTEEITKALQKHDEVRLIGFGTFGVRKRNARKGVNPQSGKEIKIKAKNVPFFRPGNGLKDSIK